MTDHNRTAGAESDLPGVGRWLSATRAKKAISEAASSAVDEFVRDGKTGAILARSPDEVGEVFSRSADKARRTGFGPLGGLVWRGVGISFMHGEPTERVEREVRALLYGVDGLVLTLVAEHHELPVPVPRELADQPRELLDFVRRQINRPYAILIPDTGATP